MMAHLTSKAARVEYGKQWGKKPEADVPLYWISPSLDLILTRPLHPAHSEYAGITELMHWLLRDIILSPDGREAYAAALRTWPFPPGARSLLNPLHHLGNYDLSANGCWSIIIPNLLRDWLEQKHMVPSYTEAATKHGDPVALVVSAFAALAKSNSVLMGSNISKDDRHNLKSIIFTTREKFNLLNIIASQAAMLPTKANYRADTQAATAEPEAGREEAQEATGDRLDPAETVGQHAADALADALANALTETDPRVSKQKTKKAAALLGDTMRPNIHATIHYAMFAEEYTTLKNVWLCRSKTCTLSR